MSPPPHQIKCPCCNNPWAAATGDMFAKICQECEESPETTGKGLSRKNMDFDVHPKTNFYQYANGSWLKENPIPSGYPNWNSFLTLHVQSQENLKNLLEELAKSATTEDEKKVSLYYKTGMDEDSIESAGTKPLVAVLESCDQVASYFDDAEGNQAKIAEGLGAMALKWGISSFVGIGVSPDNKNSDHSIAQLSQGGLGLPDRDYYFDDDKEQIREEYKKCIALMLTMSDDPDAKEATEANTELASQVYDLEAALAKEHMTRTENRDPHATYNKMTMTELCEKAPEFDFPTYWKAVTGGKSVDEVGDINVRNVKAIECVAATIPKTSATTMRAYLRWRAIKSCAPYMNEAFVQAHFDFFEKTLSGTQELKPRWKRVMAFTESALGEALGKLYCAKYFDDTSKARALKIVEQVRQALEDRLKEVEWIKADSTREQALKKMERFRVKIG